VATGGDGRGQRSSNHAARGRPTPTGHGKQIETYLCAHVAVHGQHPPCRLPWLGRWRWRARARAVPSLIPPWQIGSWHWRAHVLVLVLSRPVAGAHGSIAHAMPQRTFEPASFLVRVLFRGQAASSLAPIPLIGLM
jgi:hypothetical protein